MKIKRWTVLIVILVFFMFVSVFFGKIFLYSYDIEKNNEKYNACFDKKNKYLDNSDTSSKCFKSGFNKLAHNLLLYNVDFIDNKNQNYTILEGDFARIIPEALIEKSNVFIGYGISQNIELEDRIALLYEKPVFTFDCGIKSIATKSKNCKFYPECIATDKYIKTEYGQISTKKIHSFSNKIKELNLENKKILLKLSFNIKGEYEALQDILKNPQNKNQLTGIIIAIQPALDSIQQANEITNLLKNDFVLVSKGTCRKTIHNTDSYFETNINTPAFKGNLGCNLLFLVYANKNILNNYAISLNQNDALFFRLKSINKFEFKKNNKVTKREIKKAEDLNVAVAKIRYPVVFIEKIKELKNSKND